VPALPDVPGVLRCQIQWTDAGDVGVFSTVFLSYTGSEPDASDCSNIATAIANAFGAEKAYWGSNVTLTGVKVTDLTSATAGQGEASADFQGTNDSGSLAGGTALVVSYEIARRYRGGKPRNYFPWGTVGALATAQTWGSDYVASWATAIATIFSTIIGTEEGGTTISNHVNVSYYSGFTVVNPGGGKRARNVPTLRETPVVDTITARNVLARPGSQRRRNI
jgi:hypothetical protein